MWTGIPVFKLTEAESQKLIRMEDELHKRVIGQEEAIVAVSKSIRRARAGIKDPKRPTGSFIFLGPSGVGKTELARTLAEFLFGDEDAMIQVDMSEYMEKHSVSRLVGSPPGYIGYDEGGQLTEAVRRKPYSVVLLDEIEKAHPDVFNILLQILEDGKLTDAQGRKVDFRNTIVIMTSNIGAATISKNQSLGFSVGDDTGLSYDEMKDRIMGELKKVFRPELLNRIDEVIVFHKLTKDEIKTIVDLMMKRLREQMGEHEAAIELTDEAKELLVDKGYDPAMGARPLRRAIQRFIEDPLADFVLGRELEPGSTIVVDRKNDGGGRHHDHPGRDHAREGHRPAGGAEGPPKTTSRRLKQPASDAASRARCRRRLHDRPVRGRARRVRSRSRSRGSCSASRTSLRRRARSTAARTRCRCSRARVAREPAPRPSPAEAAGARVDRGPALHRRPRRVAPGDRGGRRRPRDRARKPAGRARRPARLGDPARAAAEAIARRDPGRARRRRPHLGRLRARRVRPQPGARRRVRDPDRTLVLGLPARPARGQPRRPPAGGPLFERRSPARSACIPVGLICGNLDWAPDWKAQGYLVLLALSSQALGWLLISITLPRLPAALTSVLLTFQPVLAVLFAWAIAGRVAVGAAAAAASRSSSPDC